MRKRKIENVLKISTIDIDANNISGHINSNPIRITEKKAAIVAAFDIIS